MGAVGVVAGVLAHGKEARMRGERAFQGDFQRNAADAAVAEEQIDEGLAFQALQGPEAGAGKGCKAGARREAPAQLFGFGQGRAVPGLPAPGLGREAARSAFLGAASHSLSLPRPGSLPR